MKIVNKILIFALLILGLINICGQDFSYASSLKADVGGFEANVSSDTVSATVSLKSIGNRFLGFLRVVSALTLVIIIGTTGYKYIVATPEIKKELKKEMLPIILGLILIFGAVSLAAFILKAVGG